MVFFFPNALGHFYNYIPANPLVTPSHIQPEFYFVGFYSILRSIPNKLLGVIAMISSILILFTVPFLDKSRIRSCQFRPIMKFFFWFFIIDFFILSWIGLCTVEEPYETIGKLATIYYFIHFILIIPVISIIENTLADLRK